MTEYVPAVSCVVIGLNCEKTLAACLQSVQAIDYVKPIEIIYVDSGSADRSVSVAKSVKGVAVIELNLKKPTPGRTRNAGWIAAKGEWIQFYDSDTIAEVNWIMSAIKNIEADTGAIFGILKEARPDRNRFHFIADLEWQRPASSAKFFGGNVLVKRSILEKTRGFDEGLIAGEDPELAVRIRSMRYKIKGIGEAMCRHDVDIESIGQYLRRAYRTGCAYALAGPKMLKNGENVWSLKMIKIIVKCVSILALAGLSLFPGFHAFILLALAINFYPLIKIVKFRRQFKISLKDAASYGLHCSVVFWPQFFGILKYSFWRNG